MARLKQIKISGRTVDRHSVEKDTVYWDRALPGFGIRVYATGGKVYVAQTRAGGRSRRVTIGRHGVITAEEARRRSAGSSPGNRQGSPPRTPNPKDRPWRKCRNGIWPSMRKCA